MAVQLTVSSNADLVRKGLQDLAANIPRLGREPIYKAMVRARSRLKASVRRPKSPINWDSEKQKRAFFATDGFGRGIPSQRTGRYPKGWRLVSLSNGYRIENPVDYAKYVGGSAAGKSQSSIHQSRYPLFRDVVMDEVRGLPKEIESNLRWYAKSRGF